MIDQTSQFFAILTNIGVAKQANANALGIPWKITHLGVGDANGTDPIPAATQTKLINERRRAPLNRLSVDPSNAAVIVAEQVIPEDVGGWWIREIGLYDDSGDLVAIANCAPSFKPLLTQGSGRTQVVRMNMIVSNTSNIELKIDPSVVLATRAYVDSKVLEELNKQDYKHSALVATTANIVLSGLPSIDGVAVTAGSRVLVKDQATGKENGIYVAAVGAWVRALDADSSLEVTPGLFVHIEQGTISGDSVWQLVTDAPIVLGTTALVFEMAVGRTGINAGTYRSVTVDKYGRVIAGNNPTTLAGYNILDAYTQAQTNTLLAAKAPSNSPTFTGTVTVPTPAIGSNNKQAVNAEYVVAAVAALVAAAPGALDTLSELAAALGNDPNFATTITNELAKKLKPGDYGVGGNAVDFPDNNLSNSVAPSGLYRTSTGALNAPPGAMVQGSLVRQEVWNGGVVQQWFGEHITGRLWRRACNTGTWSPSWAELVMGIEGAVVAFAMPTPPVGWVICNGAALSRTTYAALFARIGTTFGAGDGSTTFNVPDVRGKVIRAADLGSGVDPSRVFGSDQMDAFPDHGHINTVHSAYGASSAGSGGEFLGAGAPGAIQVSGRVLGAVALSGGSIRTANETRMKNIALLVCIKY